MPNRKTLMIIGAGWEQIPLLETAKRNGYTVLATDPNPHAAGFSYADATELLDPRDLRRALLLAKSYGIHGVTADQCDYSHFAAVYLGKCLGLPHDGLEAAQVTTNKRWMREHSREGHILQPRFFACRTFDEVKAASEIIDYPLIVKPVDNRGSFGVHRVDQPEELEAAYLDALLNAHSREVLVEAYIEGTHITVDGCVDQEGRHHNLAIATKRVLPGEKPIITEVFYPAEVTPETRDYILKTNQDVISALGIRAGATHSEYIVDDRGRCFLVETANRGGGVLTSGKIIPHLTGVDVSSLLVANAMQTSYEVKPESRETAVMLTFFVFPSGQVKRIAGVERVAGMDGVLHFSLLIAPGQELTTPESGAGRHGFAILAGRNREEIEALRANVQAAIEIEYEAQ